MKVFIAGANGRVGKALIAELTGRGYSVTAGVRNPENFEINSNVDIVQFDLTAPVEQIAQKIAGADAIYFVAGSRGKNLLQIDAFGSVKLQQTAERAGIKRFIQLSAILQQNLKSGMILVWHLCSTIRLLSSLLMNGLLTILV